MPLKPATADPGLACGPQASGSAEPAATATAPRRQLATGGAERAKERERAGRPEGEVRGGTGSKGLDLAALLARADLETLMQAVSAARAAGEETKANLLSILVAAREKEEEGGEKREEEEEEEREEGEGDSGSVLDSTPNTQEDGESNDEGSSKRGRQGGREGGRAPSQCPAVQQKTAYQWARKTCWSCCYWRSKR